jgi:EAL and modified HD-GYP domain-containing signal transduction protein
MDTFIARQPIFDTQQRVYGYELLFRSGLDNVFKHPDPNQATSKSLQTASVFWGCRPSPAGKALSTSRDILLRVSLPYSGDLVVEEILKR